MLVKVSITISSDKDHSIRARFIREIKSFLLFNSYLGRRISNFFVQNMRLDKCRLYLTVLHLKGVHLGLQSRQHTINSVITNLLKYAIALIHSSGNHLCNQARSISTKSVHPVPMGCQMDQLWY